MIDFIFTFFLVIILLSNSFRSIFKTIIVAKEVFKHETKH